MPTATIVFFIYAPFPTIEDAEGRYGAALKVPFAVFVDHLLLSLHLKLPWMDPSTASATVIEHDPLLCSWASPLAMPTEPLDTLNCDNWVGSPLGIANLLVPGRSIAREILTYAPPSEGFFDQARVPEGSKGSFESGRAPLGPDLPQPKSGNTGLQVTVTFAVPEVKTTVDVS
jgi:hypothetical protein